MPGAVGAAGLLLTSYLAPGLAGDDGGNYGGTASLILVG